MFHGSFEGTVWAELDSAASDLRAQKESYVDVRMK